MRFALAAALAAVIGSQADAQILRRSRASVTNYYYPSASYSASGYYYPSSGVVTSGYYTTPSTVYYSSPSTVVTGSVIPSSSVVVPSYSSTYVAPAYSSTYVTPSYFTPGYSNTSNYYVTPRYGLFGRRW
jgi:hypothetical protein